jgi:predicted amidophosphoribosyltransferase
MPRLSTDRSAGPRFVWPPKPVAVHVQTPVDAGSGPQQARSGQATVRDAKPPIRAADEPATKTSPRSADVNPLVRPRPPSAWSQIERVWLGLVTPPLPERMAQAGWAPDDPAAYCPRCGGTVGPFEVASPGTADPGCTMCRGKTVAWEQAVRLGEYGGLLRDLVHEVKFTAWRRLGQDLGLMLGERVRAALEAEGLNPACVAVVPVGMTFWRRMHRGIDHAMVLSRGVAKATGGQVVPALSRSYRPSQVSVSPSQRWRNVAGSFRLKPGVDLSGRLVIVVDDVRTTGATMTAACRTLVRGHRPRPAGGRNPARPAPRVWAAFAAVAAAGRTSPAGPAGPGLASGTPLLR